jgi:hypothetical protein
MARMPSEQILSRGPLSYPALFIRRTPGWLYVVAFVAPAAALGIATLGLGLDPFRLLIDPSTQFGQSLYIGAFSHIGVLAWWTAAASCALSALAVRDRTGSGGPVAALACGAALSALLGLDDLFLLHERALPAHVGIPQNLIFIGYSAWTAVYLWRFRSFHARMDTGLLVTTLMLFATSMVMDVLHLLPPEHKAGLVIEDGAKLLGATGWAVYHARAAYHALVQHPYTSGEYLTRSRTRVP